MRDKCDKEVLSQIEKRTHDALDIGLYQRVHTRDEIDDFCHVRQAAWQMVGLKVISLVMHDADGVKTFFLRQRDLLRHGCKDAIRANKFQIRPRQGET